ncbi:putative polyketide synthase 14 [Bienertia sinuspersici]
MLSLTIRRLQTQNPRPCLLQLQQQLRQATSDAGQPRHRRRPKFTAAPMKKTDDKSEWWVVDGEMHEIGENVPLRERFVIPRNNIPNRRRKQLREQFMRRTRLVLKDTEQESFCKKYMQLYNELRENWERLYWEEGYSKKLAADHTNYDSPEDDDEDFSPYRRGGPHAGRLQEQGSVGNRQTETWEKVNQIRDKFEYDREMRMRDKAFAPMNMRNSADDQRPASRNQPFDAQRYFSGEDDDDDDD